VPTEKGYRYFVNMIKEEKALLAPESVVARKRIFSASDKYGKKVEAASRVLSELTKNIAFSGFPGSISSSGLGNLFSQPEFADPYNSLKGELPREFDTEVYIGSESPIGKGAGCSLVVSQFRTPDGRNGYLGVVGPMRMSYPKTIAAIKEVRKVLEEENA
jgi:transcriptional regulator of heat shock response